MLVRTVIWVLLISCVVVAVVGLAASLGEFGTTMFVLGSVGFLVLALAAYVERRWFRG
jgi:ABC-type molybdate transport system permease subunit